MTAAPRDIKAIRQEGVLQIVWQDDSTSRFPFRFLRESCTCAACIHEITGERILDVDSIPDDITIEDASLVGNYALKIHWSDGHDTGLYTWEHLRSLPAEG